MRRALAACLLLLVLTPGCQSLRAEAGVGLGFGVELSLPALLHTGLGLGGFTYVGHHYDRGFQKGRTDGDWDHSASGLFIHSVSHHGAVVPSLETWRAGEEHTCGALAPLAWDLLRDKDTRHSYALELGVHLIVFSLRLGFNPWYLWQ